MSANQMGIDTAEAARLFSEQAKGLFRRPNGRAERRAAGQTNARRDVRLTEPRVDRHGHRFTVWVASTRAVKRVSGGRLR